MVAAFSFLIYSNALISLSPEASFGVTECCGDCCLYIVPGEVTVKTLQSSGNPYFQDFLIVDVSQTPGACYDGDILDITTQAVKESSTQYIQPAAIFPNTINFATNPKGYTFISTQIVTTTSPTSDVDQLRFYRGADMCGAVPVNISVESTNNEEFGFNPLHTEFTNAAVGTPSSDTYVITEESDSNAMDVTGTSTGSFVHLDSLRNDVIATIDMNQTSFDRSSFIISQDGSESIGFSMTPGSTSLTLPSVFVALNEIQTERGIIKIPIATTIYPEGLEGAGYVSKSVPGVGILGFVLISMISSIFLLFVDKNKKSAV